MGGFYKREFDNLLKMMDESGFLPYKSRSKADGRRYDRIRLKGIAENGKIRK